MKYELVCFDLDGTIIDETISIWQTIHEHLSTDPKVREKATKRFYNNEISYEEWALHDVELWKNAGASKTDIFAALRPLKLMKGASELLSILKKNKIKLALISGSLNIALEKVLPNYKEIFDYVFINEIFFDENGKIAKLNPTVYDSGTKADALLEVCKKEGIRPENCVFVGDNHNDIDAAKAAGFSISFNSQIKELDEVSDVIIKEKDLMKVLEHL